MAEKTRHLALPENSVQSKKAENPEQLKKSQDTQHKKKGQDLKPDIVLRSYWSGNEQFADLFNAALFGGRPVIRPQELENADTDGSSVLVHRETAESISASRDNIKIRKKSTVFGVEFVLLGLEHQEHVHYAMPLRVMGYDYGAYKKQYDRNAGRHGWKGRDFSADEYLSRMKKTDRFTPVITLVVYYGEKPWDGALSLHGILDIPEEMKAFVNDYKIFLIEARENDLTLHHAGNADFFNMLKVILDNSLPRHEARERAIAYAREHKVDKSVIMTVAGAANCKIDYNELSGKGEAGMCTLFDEIAREGEERGRARGMVEAGLEFGISEDAILKKLQEKLDLSLQAAQEYLKKFGVQTV